MKKTPCTVFRSISELYTFEGAAKKSGRKVTDEDLGRIEKAALVSSGGRIEWVGPESALPATYAQNSKEEDLGGRVVIPALLECHTHTVFAGSRASEFERRLRGESYQSIAASGGGILSTVKATREANEQELITLAQERVNRFISQGVTTVEIKSGYGLNAEDEMKMLRAAGKLSGARIVRTFLGAHAIPKESSSAETYIDTLIETLATVASEKLASRVDIFIEKGYFSPALGEKYIQAAKSHGFDVTVHADQLSRFGGAELAIRMKARSADHLIEINDDDIARLSASEVTCVLLPSADLYMKCPYPKARRLIDSEARVALATDFNPGTSPSQDVALVGILARLEMNMSLSEVLGAYTIGAAYALGLESQLGSLSKGKLCDFCGLESGIEQLFLEVGRQPIATVYRESQRLL